MTRTPATQQQLRGEAKVLRAFFYFYLVNLFGDVPIVTSTDFTVNSVVKRSPVSAVYEQIIADLEDAKSLLSDNYLDGNLQKYSVPERVRPTKWAASALLARAYLFNNEYQNAESEATAVIGNTSLFGLSLLSEVFQKNSNEAIWQLQPVTPNHNTEEGWLFVLPETGPDSYSWPVYLDSAFLGEFETGDERKNSWIGSVAIGSETFSYPYKYKEATFGSAVTEYLMVFRLAEQYLIRAEAKAQQNDMAGGLSDLNAIRNRASLANSDATDQSSLLKAIMQERQVELFTEWANRWLDLKRTNSIDAIMTDATIRKGGEWNNYQQLYPLPLSDIQRNPNLTQNTGY
jgi:starch-binding outer membrane protein, SusD/RagB family